MKHLIAIAMFLGCASDNSGFPDASRMDAQAQQRPAQISNPPRPEGVDMGGFDSQAPDVQASDVRADASMPDVQAADMRADASMPDLPAVDSQTLDTSPDVSCGRPGYPYWWNQDAGQWRKCP